MTATIKRHPDRPFSAVPLSEELAARQIKKGLFTIERGEPFALPVDRLSDPTIFQNRKLWVHEEGKVFRPGSRETPIVYGRQDLPENLRRLYDQVSLDDMKLLYRAKTGRDMHFSMTGNLWARHWHVGWANPFTGETQGPIDPTFDTYLRTHWGGNHLICRLKEKCPAIVWPSPEACLAELSMRRGWVEEIGWISGALVTSAFVSEIVDELVSATGSEFADFDYHEVGTSSTAESNAHTALQTSSGIARATGTPTDSDPDYDSVATITADASETWAEHGIFNNLTGAAMMDRNLTGGQAVVSSDQVEYTYSITFAPEV